MSLLVRRRIRETVNGRRRALFWTMTAALVATVVGHASLGLPDWVAAVGLFAWIGVIGAASWSTVDVCPGCGDRVESFDNFCSGCGASLEDVPHRPVEFEADPAGGESST